ncbi:hypothetical protein [Romboutsia lituseburensis]|uniref:hypothetical protein n=1 Tax=Romboutsia lituseburensis TaxID=1537 RepID=UPI00215ADEC3|nr:hypothetical protein [Romboutsia lituseburensis]MCR8743719.1 hypothetical protein [Romboutsia lituseburensis]
MLAIDLMMIGLLIFSVILLTGVKIMIKNKYIKSIIFLLIMYAPFSNLIEGYMLGEFSITFIIISIIVILLIFWWGYKSNKHIYSIHNAKQKDIINIIESYLELKNIKYETTEPDIYLTELCKTIHIDSYTEINLDCRDIKDLDFYNELVENVRLKIKKIKGSRISLEGLFYLAGFGIVYWIRGSFLVGFIK